MEQHQGSPESNLCPECLLILALCQDCREDKEIFDEIFYSKFNDLFIETGNSKEQFPQQDSEDVSPTEREKSKFKELLHSKVRINTIKRNQIEKFDRVASPEKKQKKRKQKKEKVTRKIQQFGSQEEYKNEKQTHQEKIITKPKQNEQNELKLESSLLDALQFYQIDPDTCDQIFSNK